MKRLLVVAVMALLSGCGGGASLPPPGPPPAPTPRPGIEAFALDLSTPSIGLGMACTGDVPVNCSTLPPQFTYGTFPAPGGWGADCVDPGPNPCYSVVNGVLRLTAPGTGFPVITRQTFSKDGTISEQMVASAECLAAGCWGGLVLYNGDAIPPAPGEEPNLATGNWRGIYFSHAGDGKVQMGMWSPSTVHVLPGYVYPAGMPITLRIDYTAGAWAYFVNGNLAMVESDQNPSVDPRPLLNDPHAAVFLGDLNLNVSSWDLYVAP